ncbi:MAG: LPS export ABC transporter periplasmic protein LptC [Neisseria sp.]|nr:LPS export ABC transporter periplasmic protein LptC [Neisseria sp.]
MKRFSSLLFPLVLSLLLGGTGFWLNRATEIDIETTKLDPAKPQYTMFQVQAQRFDAAGRLQDNLNATQAWQLPESRKIYFSRPDIKVWENGKKQYDLIADKGVYDMDSKQADFTQNVQILKYNEAGQTTAMMNSDYLSIDTANQSAKTLADDVFRNAAAHGESAQPTPKKRVKTVIYDVPKPN